MKLHEKNDVFKDAIQAAADHFGIRTVFVEKDYWVTFVLKTLSASKHADIVVFKGGTSISKAYGVAKRFSEDVDLALIAEKDSTAEENAKRMAEIEKVIAISPLQETVDLRIQSRNKLYRQTHWEYPKKMSGAYDPAKDKLKLEFVSNANTDPHDFMAIQSLVAEFFVQSGRDSEVDEFDLRPFKIKVLSHKRTFAEKVVAVSNAGLANDKGVKLKRQIRHLYDLTLLLKDSVIADFVKTEIFEQMVEEAREGDKQIPDLKEVASKPWKTSLVFEKTKETLKSLKTTYESELGPLVFDRKLMPKLTEIERMLKTISGQPLPPKRGRKSKPRK